MKTLIWDLETNGLLAEVTKIHCMVIHDQETGLTWKVTSEDDATAWKLGVEMLMEADVIVGHNIVRFDIPVLQKFYPWFKPKGKVRDTLVIAKLIWPNLKSLDKGDSRLGGDLVGKHSLKAWGIRLGVLKGDYAETADWKTFTPEMLEYCVQDVTGPTLALWKLIQKKNYSEEAIQTETDFTFVAHQMELHGFRFDVEGAQKLHARLVKRKLELEAQLQEKYKGWSEDMKTPEYWEGGTILDPSLVLVKAATKSETEKLLWQSAKPGGIRRKDLWLRPGPLAKKRTPFNPGSRTHIRRVLMEEHGWEPVKFTDGGEAKLDEEILENLDIPEAKLLIEYLMLDKRLGQLAEGDNAWLKLVKDDGRIYGRIDAMGAVTSRCSHSGPNMAQIPAVMVDENKNPLMAEAGRWGYECRALFLPDEGHVLVGADASGIQLRVIAHYAGAWDGGKYVELVTKGDVHTANQQAAGLPSRGTAKTFIYAWLLGAGDAKIGLITGKGPKEGKRLKENFLAGFPALRALKDALRDAVKENGSIRGIDGRIMPCESAHLAMGSLLQGFEAIVMKKAMWFLYQDLISRGWVHGQDWGFCAFVHDEYQISARPDIAEDVGKAAVAAIIRAGEYFKSRCPLAGEWKIGKTWADTH
jgi:DNA polymerase I-like protein with 3'-5' exonuclease and polymerase domains